MRLHIAAKQVLKRCQLVGVRWAFEFPEIDADTALGYQTFGRARFRQVHPVRVKESNVGPANHTWDVGEVIGRVETETMTTDLCGVST